MGCLSLWLCSKTSLILVFLLSALPIAYILYSETSGSPTHTYQFQTGGWFRECTKWDDLNRRFLLSFFEGGLGVVPLPDGHASESVLKEIRVVGKMGRNSSLGLVIDRTRNRVLVAIADLLGNRYSALASYDLNTWDQIFLTQLSGPEDEKAVADDVAVDAEGNAYVTDVKGNQIWKVGANGEYLYSIKSPIFTPKEWYKNLFGLNGIVYHPSGYLLVIHTFTGNLFKIQPSTHQGGEIIKLVNITGTSSSTNSLKFGDGLELVSPTKLAVAGNPTKLVESNDEWESASVVGQFRSPTTHRIVTAATLKDGQLYLNHLLAFGKHVLVHPVFTS